MDVLHWGWSVFQLGREVTTVWTSSTVGGQCFSWAVGHHGMDVFQCFNWAVRSPRYGRPPLGGQCFSWAVRSPRYGRLLVFQLGREVTTVWTSSSVSAGP